MQHGALRIASDRDAGPEPALHAMARELAAAQEAALDLQITVAEIVASPGAASSGALFRLQELDRLAQTLGDLSAFAAAAADAAPGGWRIDARAAVRDLRLRDVAARLAGGVAACVAAPSGSEPEDDFLL